MRFHDELAQGVAPLRRDADRPVTTQGELWGGHVFIARRNAA